MANLTHIYEQFFELRMASTDQEREQAFRLRYQVYCIEAGFFAPQIYERQLEIDGFDERAAQSVLVYKPTGAPIGTVRLILADPDETPGSLPFDHVCNPAELYEQKLLPKETTAEISRFCLIQGLREEVAKTPAPAIANLVYSDGNEDTWRELRHYAKLALMRATVELTAACGVTHWCAVMEPQLVRSFEMLGAYFTLVGPPIDYHGQRQPCYRDVSQLLAGIRSERRDVWEVMTDRGRLAP